MPTTPPPPSLSRDPSPQAPERLPTEAGSSSGLLAGRYELLEILGEGGMGLVYRARDRELDEELAIKLLQRELTQSVEDIDRFKREIKTARRIGHPNVIRIFHFGQDESQAFICMELLTGGTLARLISGSAIPIERCIDIAIQVGDGLGAAHRLGVIHRDIKPHNVMFDSSGTVKLLDFGIARFTAKTSNTKGFVGTPHYISPEQADGKTATPRSDVYSFGVLLFELFTGQLPFHSDSLARLILMHVGNDPPSPRSIRADIPEDVEKIIMRCLSKRPTERYADGGRVADAFRELRGLVPVWSEGSSAGDEPLLLPADEVIAGRYRVLEPMTATSFRAHDTSTNVEVALRIVDIDPGQTDAIRTEIERTRDVSHPNLWNARDFLQVNEHGVLVSDFIEAESLAERLARVGSMPVGWALRILRGVTSGLAAAHDKGLIHGALDASHIFLLKGSDQAVVADLALANDSGGKTADVKALGRIAFQLVNGRLPSTTDSIDQLRQELPAELEDFVLRCLATNPADRPADAGSALKLLEKSIAEPTPIRTLRPVTAPGDRRRTTLSKPESGWRRHLPRAGLGATVLLIVSLVVVVGYRTLVHPGAAESDSPRLFLAPLHADAAKDQWLTDAIRASLKFELEDAWDVSGSLTEGGRVGDSLPHISGNIDERSGREIRVSLDLIDSSARSHVFNVRGSTVREVSEAAADRIVRSLGGRYDQAPTTEQLASVGATDPEAWRLWRRAQRLTRMQRWEISEKLLRQAIALDPDFPLPYLELAIGYDRMDSGGNRRLDQAVAALEKAPNVDRVWRDAVEIVAAARSGDEERAGKMFEQALDRRMTPRQRRWALTQWAIDRVEQKDLEGAEIAIQELKDRFPDDPAAYKLETSEFLLAADPGKAARATDISRRALELAPNDAETHILYGQALLLSGNRLPPEQLEVLEQFDEEERTMAAPLEYRLHMLRGDFEAAGHALNRWKRLTPETRARARHLEALLDLNRGRWTTGLARLREAARDTEDLGAQTEGQYSWFIRGWYQFQLGALFPEMVSRETSFESARKDFAHVEDGWQGYAAPVLTALLDDIENRTDSATKMLSEHPTETAWLQSTLEMLVSVQRGDPADHLKMVQRVQEQYAVPYVFFYRARTLERLSRDDGVTDDQRNVYREQAIEAYEDAVENPLSYQEPILSADGLRRLGRLYEEKGRVSDARRAYERFFERAPKDPFLELYAHYQELGQ